MRKMFCWVPAVAVMALAGCYEQPAPVVVQAPPAVQQGAPVVMQPAPVVVQQHSDNGLLTGLMLGHMMSGGSGGSHTTVRNTTVINRTYSRPSYAPSRSYSYSRSSSFSSFRRR